MRTQFVNLSSELTALKDLLASVGNTTYRTRLHCHCKPEFNRRDGVLVTSIQGNQEVVLAKLIRCKACAKGGLV